MASLAAIRVRVYDVLEALTPSVASGTPFVRWTEKMAPLHQATEPGRFRGVSVKVGTSVPGPEAHGAASLSYEVEIAIRVGYPLGEMVPISGETIDLDECKGSDFEQIDAALQSVDFLAAPALDGGSLVLLRGARDVERGRCREVVYGVQYTREVG